MNQLRIILDKSVVYGLNNLEIESLDRYFFQIVPPILQDEILADLTKEAEEPSALSRIAGNSYRISGNRGLTPNYRHLLANSLLGFENPMDGRYLPAGESAVRSEDGKLGLKIDTPLEDETIARWERKEFTWEEKQWAARWRPKAERPLMPKLYLHKIAEAGLEFTPPRTDAELVEKVDALLKERPLQAKLFPLVSRQHDIPLDLQAKVIKRWFATGKPVFSEFAPDAFFCIRADFIWTLGLTNPGLFQPNKNDRKDLEYCYYLPHTELFSSKDRKHKRLVPFLLRDNQTFVEAEPLKSDLRQLSERWNALSKDDQIQENAKRGNAPPEDESSLVFELWKKHRNEISPSLLEMLNIKVVNGSKPPEEQEEMTFEEVIRQKLKEIDAAKQIPEGEMNQLREIHRGADPSSFAVRKFRISRDRLLKLYPQLKESDLNNSD